MTLTRNSATTVHCDEGNIKRKDNTVKLTSLFEPRENEYCLIQSKLSPNMFCEYFGEQKYLLPCKEMNHNSLTDQHTAWSLY